MINSAAATLGSTALVSIVASSPRPPPPQEMGRPASVRHRTPRARVGPVPPAGVGEDPAPQRARQPGSAVGAGAAADADHDASYPSAQRGADQLTGSVA